MKSMHKIILAIGKSSSGKDTFFAECLKLYELEAIRLHTTRPMRDGEVNGREYYFISDSEMDLLDRENKLIERRDYDVSKKKDGSKIWTYATSASDICLETTDYLTLNTWVGYQKFLNYYKKENLAILYFQLDDGIRLQRALNRERKSKNSDYAEMCRRFLADQMDFRDEFLEYYKPFIIDNNGSLEETLEQIDDVMVRKLQIKRKTTLN